MACNLTVSATLGKESDEKINCNFSTKTKLIKFILNITIIYNTYIQFRTFEKIVLRALRESLLCEEHKLLIKKSLFVRFDVRRCENEKNAKYSLLQMDTSVHTFCQLELSPFICSYCSLMVPTPLPKRWTMLHSIVTSWIMQMCTSYRIKFRLNDLIYDPPSYKMFDQIKFWTVSRMINLSFLENWPIPLNSQPKLLEDLSC